MFRRATAVLIAVAGLCHSLAIADQGAKLERHEFKSPQMGTIFKIVLYGSDAESAKKAADDAFSLAGELNSKFSDYDAESELRRMLKTPQGTIASPQLFDILQRSQAISKSTGGAFDVTNGPLTRLWRLSRVTGKLPSPKTIEKAKAATGWKKLQLDAKTRRVRFSVGHMALDLGGIAKGYAADKMLAQLRSAGFPIASVAAGGDIAVGDPPPGKKGWKIALSPDGKDLRQTLTLANQAVSTSGDVEQSIEIGGKRYSHIVDPDTGLGLREGHPVSVVAPTATESDAFATALNVTGKVRGNLIQKKLPRLKAYWHPKERKERPASPKSAESE